MNHTEGQSLCCYSAVPSRYALQMSWILYWLVIVIVIITTRRRRSPLTLLLLSLCCVKFWWCCSYTLLFPALCNVRPLCLAAPNQISFLDEVLPVSCNFAVNLMPCSLESMDSFYTCHVSVVVTSKFHLTGHFLLYTALHGALTWDCSVQSTHWRVLCSLQFPFVADSFLRGAL